MENTSSTPSNICTYVLYVFHTLVSLVKRSNSSLSFNELSFACSLRSGCRTFGSIYSHLPNSWLRFEGECIRQIVCNYRQIRTRKSDSSITQAYILPQQQQQPCLLNRQLEVIMCPCEATILVFKRVSSGWKNCIQFQTKANDCSLYYLTIRQYRT